MTDLLISNRNSNLFHGCSVTKSHAITSQIWLTLPTKEVATSNCRKTLKIVICTRPGTKDAVKNRLETGMKNSETQDIFKPQASCLIFLSQMSHDNLHRIIWSLLRWSGHYRERFCLCQSLGWHFSRFTLDLSDLLFEICQIYKKSTCISEKLHLNVAHNE